MASDNSSSHGKKRSKAFYRKSAYGGKRQCTGKNILEPGIRGFLVMCHSNESSAVRESYNILNEYADLLYGPEKTSTEPQGETEQESGSDDDCEDIEKALKKEVDGLKNIAPKEKRFQNVATKAKNLVFIRTTLEDTVKVVTTVMEDIASRKLKRARYAARMLPIVGTCKAQTAAIAELASSALPLYFSQGNPDVPKSFTVMFKTRNNNGTTCGKESVISAIKHEVLKINPDIKFCWSEYDVAILVEIVCTTCCLGVAPGYDRLRKFNFQELAQGPRVKSVEKGSDTSTLNLTNTDQGEGKVLADQEPQNLKNECTSEEGQGKQDQEGSLLETGEQTMDKFEPSIDVGGPKSDSTTVLKSDDVGCVNHTDMTKAKSEIVSIDMQADRENFKTKGEKDILGHTEPLKDNDVENVEDNNGAKPAEKPFFSTSVSEDQVEENAVPLTQATGDASDARETENIST
ncbi:hypothetical protein EGW08_002363 [Elysia chlorotica]|uniref:THUMP domain-containing protein n=1 Tax=Elysia chlorotica TaxID=188477 RepID=A0A3S1I0I5_ELYCH|nr:hypothetical protein EGW08_002363 [Elysia chlorotica]